MQTRRSNRFGGALLMLAMFLLALATASRAHLPGIVEGGTLPLPEGAKVSLKFDKAEYFLGEDVSFEFVLENTSDASFKYETGGDYRGASRRLRFKVSATDAAGNACEDPDTEQPNFGGGIVGAKDLAPGKKYTETLWLPLYRVIEKPGRYTIRAWHDFGWKKGEYPVGEAVITFKAPTEAEAEQVVSTMDQMGEDRRTYYSLREPVYIGPLVTRAKGGDTKVLGGLGNIETAEATVALIEIAELPDPKVSLAAAMTLNRRLPDPEFDGKLPGRGPFRDDRLDARRNLVQRAWDKQLAPRVRALGGKFVGGKETKEIGTGAFMLQAVGAKEDAPAVFAAMDRVLGPAVDARRDPKDNLLGLPEPLGELARTIRVLTDRGFSLNGPNGEPQLSGEGQIFSYFYLLEGAPGPRSSGWLQCLEAFGENGRFSTREAAVRSIPLPLPEECRAFLGRRLEDKDLGVVRAACEVAGKSKEKGYLPAILDIIAAESHPWLLRSAGDAAAALGGGFALHRAWVERLPDEDLFDIALDDLQRIIKGLPGSSSGRTDLTRSERIALRTAWRQFLEAHKAEIEGGKTFMVGDPALSANLFGRARQWQLANGETWPASKGK